MKEKKAWWKKWWVWVIAIIVIANIGGGDETQETSAPAKEQQETTVNNEKSTDKQNEDSNIEAKQTTKQTETNSTSNKPAMITDEENKYISFMTDHSTKFSEAMTTMSEQMSNPQLGNQDWTIKTAASIVMLGVLADEAIAYQPVPEKFKNVHATYLKAMNEYKYVSDNLPPAIDKLDVNRMNELSVKLNKANEYVNLATTEATKLK